MTLVLTGSINLTSGGITTDRDGVYSGSFSGSLVGDGSGLTGVTGEGGGGSSDFPYTGSAIISGSLKVDGITEVISGSIIGDGSGLTDVQIFPFEGQADIIGGFKLDGEFEFNFASSSNGAWSTGGNLNIAKYGLAGAGTQNAALAFGGIENVPFSIDYTEAYNGVSWSERSLMNQDRNFLAGAGTQNAALASGGANAVTCTEEYNGKSWSVGGSLNTGRSSLTGTGTQNAGLSFGGQAIPSPTGLACTEEYNGNSWSIGGNLSVGKRELAGAGTQNTTLAFGGLAPSPATIDCSENYNGVSWSAVANLNTVRYSLGGAGTQNAALAFGGTPSLSSTEEYNGTSWSAVGSLSTGRRYGGDAGTQQSGLYFGGVATPSPIYLTGTEEYTAGICYRKHFYSQQNTVYSNQLYVTGSATADALLNLANRDTTPDPLTEGMIWQSGSANSGCLYFSPDGTSICKISFA